MNQQTNHRQILNCSNQRVAFILNKTALQKYSHWASVQARVQRPRLLAVGHRTRLLGRTLLRLRSHGRAVLAEGLAQQHQPIDVQLAGRSENARLVGDALGEALQVVAGHDLRLVHGIPDRRHLIGCDVVGAGAGLAAGRDLLLQIGVLRENLMQYYIIV